MKHRINITADKDMEKALRYAARRDGIPTATKAKQLLRNALETEEDLALAAVIKQRLSRKNIKWVSHEEAWR